MDVRDRVKEVRQIRAGSLMANPLNWRTHPPSQRATLEAAFDEIGFAGVLMAYERPDGELVLVDGHLRAELAPDAIVHVAVLDLNEEEARIALASHDSIGAMASVNNDVLIELLGRIETDSEPLSKLFEALANNERYPMPALGEPTGGVPATERSVNYSRKIETPVYEITGENPPAADLYDETRTKQLEQAISETDLPDDVALFLRAAAQRHTVFNFARIAEFYAHADADVQRLMEDSALVIIDFGRAIELGFVATAQRLGEIADLDGEDEDEE